MVFKETTDSQQVADYLAKRIASALKKGLSVLWLAAGGSGIELAASAAQQLNGQNLSKLTVTLTDERYGNLNHKDSNWRQLIDAGFVLHGAKLVPVLKGKNPQATTAEFGQFLDKELRAADYKIGLLGIGPDSHIAGIKPGSPAVDSEELATSYKWNDYERITATLPAILKLDTTVSYLVGKNKQKAIENLHIRLPLNKYPSQILKQAKEAIIFSNSMEEEQ